MQKFNSAEEAVKVLGEEGVIERLKIDEEYYGEFGMLFISTSQVKKLLKNPKEFGLILEAEKKEFLIGRYFHTSLLEPEKAASVPFVDCSTRTTKEYKKYLEETGIGLAMIRKERDETDELVRVIQQNFKFFEIINDDNAVYEIPTIGQIDGVWFKAKADILGDEFVDDLKTDRDIEWFRYNAIKNGYHIAAYIYGKLFKKPMRFLVIDKSTKMLGIYNMSEEKLQEGKMAVDKALEVRNKFFIDGSENIDSYYYSETI